MPKGLYGHKLKRSNERILLQYGNLAKFFVRRYARMFGLSREQYDDALQSVFAEICKAAPSYRNGPGMNVVIRTKTLDVMKRITKSKVEMAAGLMRENRETFRGDFEGEHWTLSGIDMDKGTCWNEPSTAPPNLVHVDVGFISRHLDSLPSTERTVLSLLYGLDGNESFSEAIVSKKLGRNRWWVMRKHAHGIARLQKSLGIAATPAVSLRPQPASLDPA